MNKIVTLLFCLSNSQIALARTEYPGIEALPELHRRLEANGCWVRLYDEPSYSGDQLVVYDGMSLPTLYLRKGSDWRNRVRSLEVGPGASATFYLNESYEAELFEAGPGVRLAGPWNRTESVKLECLEEVDPPAKK